MTENNKIKVLHIITRLDAGGSSANTIETAARLNKDKYAAFLIAGRTHDPKGDIVRSLQLKGVQYSFVDDLRREINPWLDLKAFIKLYKMIKEGHYDLVHTHTSKAGILGRWAGRAAGVKHIVHTPHGHVFYGYFNKFMTKIFIIVEQCTASITHKIITLTERGKEEHILFKIAPPDKFIPIYSGIDIKALSQTRNDIQKTKETLKIPQDSFVFGTVARLDPVKGIKFLVEAMSKVIKDLPKSRLLIIGDGSQRKQIEEQILSLGLKEHVILTGHREDIAELLQVMDIFVLPSLNEGMGRVILEAMVFAKPVIATRTGGIPEVVGDGKTGLLVPAAQADLLAEAMIKLASNPAWAKELGENGKSAVQETFSLEKMVLKIEQLYNELLVTKK